MHDDRRLATTPPQIAVILRARKEELISLWKARVRDDPAVPEANRLSEPALRDHVPRMLDRFTELLETCDHGEGERAGRSLGHDEASAQHAAHRFASSYEMSAALRELSHLRMAMFDLFDVHRASPDVDTLRVLSAALDESMKTTAVEMERAAKEALQSEVARRERFVAMLAHDLRQPLHSMLFSAAVLAAVDGLDEGARRAVDRTKRAAERMAAMIDEVLDASRLRHGAGIALTLGDLDLRELVARAVDEARAAMPGARIDVSGSGDLSGRWDAERLAQIASNLLGNAVKHGAEEVPVRVLLRDEGACVALRVENDNRHRAIPAELMPVLFDPFARGTGTARGLGLGLYIAREIAQAHGGTIEAETNDAATAFTVRLPRNPSG